MTAVIPSSSIAATVPTKGGWVRRNLAFESNGVELQGALFRPSGVDGKLPGLVISGPFGSVKEQSPVQYATRLAKAGYACLIFDPTGSGASGGAPRRTEGPSQRQRDIRAATDALAADPGTDTNRIGGLGICQGASYMMFAVAEDPRLKVLACISGQYLYKENLEGFFSGGGPTLDERIARGNQAKAREAAGGPVEYIPVISPTDKSVALPWREINDWYARWDGLGWGSRTTWENRVTASSDADVWTVDVRKPAGKIDVPTLILHGEKSDGFLVAARTVYDSLRVNDRKLIIEPGVFHTRFYDDPEVVDNAVSEVVTWLAGRL
ncbi:alpha/beta hydrolase [Asticcacaulis taihuensis]|nr:alpha/beta hydrolase [Asticcacaulis taihuensis]